MRRARPSLFVLALAWATVGLLGCASIAERVGSGAARPAWELPPPPVSEAPVVQPGTLHRAALENGLRVMVLEDRRLPRAVLGVTFRRGEASVSRERAGLASFTAELMKRGAGDRDALAFAEYVDEIGASLAVGADWDSLSVGVTGLSRDLDRLFEILSEVVLAPRFEQAEADRARAEKLAAIERAKDDPSTLSSWYMAEAVYPEHRFGLPIGGTPETVARFDETAARALHAQLVFPNDAVLYASGDVSVEDILARARAAFGAWQPGTPVDAGSAPPAQTPAARKILIVNRPDLVQARIAVSHEGIARTDDDRVATGLMASVLGGGGFSSRLFSRLRADEGLTYGVHAGYSLRRLPGPFFAATFTRVSEVRRALDLLLEELARIRVEPPTADELGWARTLAVGRFSMGLETSAAVMDGLVDLEVYGLPEDSLDTYRARVRATDDAAVARAALDHVHADRAAIVLVGPAEQLVPQVEDLGPIEIVEP
jgi:zinc protease